MRIVACLLLVHLALPAVAAPATAGPPGAAASQPKSAPGNQANPAKAPTVPAPATSPQDLDPPKPADIVEQAILDMEATQLTDGQYERLKQLYIRRERQKATPYVTPPKPVTRTLPVNLDPGISPPVLRLSRGSLTSVVFSDLNGNPWAIKDVAMARELFTDGREEKGQGTSAESTNVLMVEPRFAAAYGNVTVRLKGLPTPVIFILTTAQQEVDLRVDAKVPGRNPDSTDVVTLTAPPSLDLSIPSFLDGVPPQDARRLRVTGQATAEAWLYENNLYLRTDADVQYPAYYSSARSTSGKAVYRFHARHHSVTLLSQGRAVTVFIDD